MPTLARTILLAVALLALPSSGPAQEVAAPAQQPPRHGGHVGEGRAFQLLLQRRAELGLTEAQAERLGGIQRALEAANAPLRARLAEERQRFLAERRAQLERMTPEERRAELERMRERGRPPMPPSMRPLAEEMRRNIHSAMRQAHDVLTPEQRERLRALMQERRSSPRGHHGRHPGAEAPAPARP